MTDGSPRAQSSASGASAKSGDGEPGSRPNAVRAPLLLRSVSPVLYHAWSRSSMRCKAGQHCSKHRVWGHRLGRHAHAGSGHLAYNFSTDTSALVSPAKSAPVMQAWLATAAATKRRMTTMAVWSTLTASGRASQRPCSRSQAFWPSWSCAGSKPSPGTRQGPA